MTSITRSLLMLLPCGLLQAIEPAAPAAKTEEKASPSSIAVTAAIAGAEFNRLVESSPELKKAVTVDAALHSLSSTQKPVHKALDKNVLTGSKKEIIALLVMQDGKLIGAPQLNDALAGIQTSMSGAKARRNAQNIVSVFSAARAAGSVELEGVKNLEQAVAFVRTGIKGGGPFAGSVFKVEVDDASLKAALTFIGFDEAQGGLTYKPETLFEAEDDGLPAPPAPDAVAMIGQELRKQAESEAKGENK